jgi:hypothetical protein
VPAPIEPPGTEHAILQPGFSQGTTASGERKTSGLKIGAFVTLGVAIGALGAGIGLAVAAHSRGDTLSQDLTNAGGTQRYDPAQKSAYEQTRDEGNLFSGLSIGFFAGAGAAAVITAVLFGVNAHQAKTEHASLPDAAGGLRAALAPTRLSPVISHDVAGLGAEWSY